MDGITQLRFCPDSENFLLVSSWDSGVRVYDVNANQIRSRFSHKAGVLDCCFANQNLVFSSGIDRTIKVYDIQTAAEDIVGTHEKGIRCIEYSPAENLLISGSWDTNIKLWDIRIKNSCVATCPQPDKVYTMSLAQHRLVVGTAGRHVQIYDLRCMGEPQQRRESSLKFQTRCIRTFPDNTGYALSSIEGRVAIEYFDPAPEVQARKYAFKCHRTTIDGVDTVYPVNTIAFHPKYGTFATGGCDGYVNMWDGQNKKRLCQFHQYPTSIAALSFNSSGGILAIASSYTFEEGEKEHEVDTIYIRNVTDLEVKPKLLQQK